VVELVELVDDDGCELDDDDDVDELALLDDDGREVVVDVGCETVGVECDGGDAVGGAGCETTGGELLDDDVCEYVVAVVG